MKLLKYVLPMVVAFGFAGAAVYGHEQDGSHHADTVNNRDMDALRDYINTKRTIDVREKATNMTIAGDVRTEWRHISEKERGHQERGGNNFDDDCYRISKNDFDIELNLYFDYACDRTWAVAQLQFDNSAGVDSSTYECPCGSNSSSSGRDDDVWFGSGECDHLCLKKAYFGYNVCCECDTRFDIEVGRRNLYNVFDSKVQFDSRFDGVLFKYSSSWECVADWYWNTGVFLVDQRTNHFGWVTEAGFLNVCDWDLDLKYSFIDWQKKGHGPCDSVSVGNNYKFRISQFTFAYHFDPEVVCAPATVYGAFLWNHGAYRFDGSNGSSSSSSSSGHNKRKNLAWYLGVTVGEIVDEGDWSVDLRYELVQQNALPNQDASGICRGNVNNIRGGNVNYKGWRLEGLYALTDTLVLDARYQYSKEDDKRFNGSHKYSEFKLEAIYAF